MGVLGLTPYLQKAFPDVITRLPERLMGLKGKTIVLDGTLITMRFHFAPSGLANPHVVRWHSLIKSMREHDITPVCIFDGKQRVSAKAKETARRAEAKNLQISRRQLEEERLVRLRQIVAIRQSGRYPAPATRRKSVDSIPTVPTDTASKESIDRLAERFNGIDLAEVLSDASASGYQTRLGEESADQEPLNILYAEYLNSVATLSALPQTADPTDPIPGMIPLTADMSKTQLNLTTSEAALWESLGVATAPSRTDGNLELAKSAEDPDTLLQALVERSAAVSAMYERRVQAPTKQHYTEVREILTAMDVPIFETEGPYEAEGLASSLVLQGYADYVATEDTDVVVYGASMLRNLTDSGAPLVLLSGQAIQSALDLPKDAYIDFLILLGTDFTQRIPKVGPTTAFKYIKKHGSIEAILSAEPKAIPGVSVEEYLGDVVAAREVFKNLPPLPEGVERLKTIQTNEDTAGVNAILQRHDQLAFAAWEQGGAFFDDAPTYL